MPSPSPVPSIILRTSNLLHCLMPTAHSLSRLAGRALLLPLHSRWPHFPQGPRTSLSPCPLQLRVNLYHHGYSDCQPSCQGTAHSYVLTYIIMEFIGLLTILNYHHYSKYLFVLHVYKYVQYRFSDGTKVGGCQFPSI